MNWRVKNVTGVKKYICPIGQINDKWGDADELENPSATPDPQSSKFTKDFPIMPYEPTDYVTSAATFTDLKSQYSTGEDFQPLPQYTQTKTSNDHWVNVTTTRTDSDGSTTQSLQIISKR